MLLNMFNTRSEVRAEVLERILGDVIVNSSTAGPHIELLGQLLHSSHSMIKEHLPRLKQIFEYAVMLPAAVAQQLLVAAKPLLPLKDIQDHCVLMLRKAMCQRESEARQVAVCGFVQLLQSDQDACTPLQTEICGFLRRCLSQQPEIRMVLYTELHSIFIQLPRLRDLVLDLLVPHFMYYHEPANPHTQLKLMHCIQDTGPVPKATLPLVCLL